MSKVMGGPEIETLIKLLARIPGFGIRSARRAALHLIKKKENLLEPLTKAMDAVAQKVQTCPICHNIDTLTPCFVCRDVKRDKETIIVVEDIADLWALERAHVSQAMYHVLGGCLAPLDGVSAEDLNISSLLARVQSGSIKEVILAVNATVEGQTTAHYITDQLARFPIKVSRLAYGVPIGGELDYLDDGTLAQAVRARTHL